MQIISLQTLCDLFHCHESTIFRLANDEEFPLRKILHSERNCNYVVENELEEWLKNNNTLYRFKDKIKK